MKNLGLSGIIMLITLACSQEELIVPSEVKSLYEIQEKPNMDPVDQKIYDIWKKYKVAVYYNDTLSVEDYGQRDTLGNPVYYYQILRVTQDMTSPTYIASWTRLQTFKPEVKASLMPLLEFIDETLLDAAEKLDITIPVIILAQTYNYRSRNYKVFRGANTLVVTFPLFNNTHETQASYVKELFCFAKGERYDNILNPYYKVSEDLIFAGGYTNSMSMWGYTYSQLVSNFYTTFSNMYFLEHYDAQMATLQTQLQTAKTKYETTHAVTDFKAYSDKLAEIYAKEVIKSEEATWRRTYEQTRGLAFGFLNLPEPSTATSASGYGSTEQKSIDLESYLNLLLEHSRSELETMYADYPVVLKRLDVLDKGLKEKRIDYNYFK